MKKWFERNPWPTALVLVSTLATLGAIYALSSGEQRDQLLLGVGSVSALVLAFMRSMFDRKDS